MKTKKGHWRGGQAQRGAAAAWREMTDAVQKVLEVLTSYDTMNEGSQVPERVDTLRQLSQRYREFNIGNAFTWCCPGCNPAPESRIKSALCRIAAELQIDIIPDSASSSTLSLEPELAKRASLGRLESTLANHEWIDLVKVRLKLRGAIECCENVVAKRELAQAFIAEYGSHFRRFDSGNRYMEVGLLTIVLMFSLCVGLLQQYQTAQAVIAFSIYFLLTCYMSTNPFNEYLRFGFEMASVICFTTALFLVMLYNLDVLDDPDQVGKAVNYLGVASIGAKICYTVVSALPFYVRICTTRCCPQKQDTEDSSPPEVPKVNKQVELALDDDSSIESVERQRSQI